MPPKTARSVGAYLLACSNFGTANAKPVRVPAGKSIANDGTLGGLRYV